MAVAFLLQVLLLAGSSWQFCRAGDVQPFSKLSDGVYTLQLASTNCFLTYQNRTCAKNVPVVRPKTTLWNKWAVRVVDKEQGIVTLKTPEDYGRCPDGTLSRLIGDTCQETRSATKVGIAGQSATPTLEQELFQLVPVDDSDGPGDLYYVMAVGKRSTCARYLGATGCASGSVRTKLAAEGEEGVLTIWRVSMVQGSAPAPSPVPAPAVPSPTQAPAPAPATAPATAPASIPGPVIEPSIYGQSIVTSGFVYISVKSMGGSDACSVVSVTFTTVFKGGGTSVIDQPSWVVTYDAAELTNRPVTISLVGGHQYETYAVGMCSEGGETEMSNILTTVSVVPTSLALFCRAANGVTILCPRAEVGDTGTVDGIEYTKRDRAGLDALRGPADQAKLATSCTSGIPTMATLFRVRVSARLFLLRCLLIVVCIPWISRRSLDGPFLPGCTTVGLQHLQPGHRYLGHELGDDHVYHVLRTCFCPPVFAASLPPHRWVYPLDVSTLTGPCHSSLAVL